MTQKRFPLAATCALVGLVGALILLLTSPVQAEEPQVEDPRAVHMSHYAQIYRWERAFARPRSGQLWQQITARPRGSLRSDRARVEYILALRPALRELRTLTQERKDAVLSGYCLDKDAEESTVLELMNEFGNTAIRLADQAVLLEFALTNGEDSACAALYGSADWVDRSSWFLFQPSLGWPLES